MDWNRYTLAELQKIAIDHYIETYNRQADFILSYNRDCLIRLLKNLNTYAHALHKHFKDGLEDSG